MFILYALPLGILTGWLSGGQIQELAEIKLRWAPLALLGLLIQVVLFFGPVAEKVGLIGMPIYVGSTALVLVAVLRNAMLPGLPLVLLGALSNMTAILANGGYMPASPGALAVLGAGINPGYSNSAVIEQPALAALTDIFAIPPSVPFANVFSVGDVLIGLGVALALVASMHGRSTGVVAGLVAGLLGRARMTAAPDHLIGDATGLARLTPVDPATIWTDGQGMAEWLQQSSDALPEAVSISLKDALMIESERPVLVGGEAESATVLVCELGPSSDEGFGCLIRHVAAFRAERGVWICSDPSDEHASTMAWMNDAFGTRFSLLRLSLVRIGSSEPAPAFESVIRPFAPSSEVRKVPWHNNGQSATVPLQGPLPAAAG